MPAYRDLYPSGLVQEIWPMTLVPGESDPPRQDDAAHPRAAGI